MSKVPASRQRHDLVPPIAKTGPAALSFGALSRDGAFAWLGYEDEVALFDCETKERRAVWMFQKLNDAEEEEEVKNVRVIDGKINLFLPSSLPSVQKKHKLAIEDIWWSQLPTNWKRATTYGFLI